MGKYLDSTGLSHLMAKLKAAFAAKVHSHAPSDIVGAEEWESIAMTPHTVVSGAEGSVPPSINLYAWDDGTASTQLTANAGIGVADSGYEHSATVLAEYDGSIAFVTLSADTYRVSNPGEFRDAIDAQEALVSGTNIKTVNGQSILGSGDISISGGSSAWQDVKSLLLAADSHWADVLDLAAVSDGHTAYVSGIFANLADEELALPGVLMMHPDRWLNRYLYGQVWDTSGANEMSPYVYCDQRGITVFGAGECADASISWPVG